MEDSGDLIHFVVDARMLVIASPQSSMLFTFRVLLSEIELDSIELILKFVHSAFVAILILSKSLTFTQSKIKR